MDIDERKIGEWPNVALVPGTHIHAATGKYVEQPENTRIGRSRGADGPQAAEPEPEPADAGSEPQDGAECVDTRDKINRDAGLLVGEYAATGEVCDVLYRGILDLLDRQAAITRFEVDEMRDCADCTEGMLANMQQQVDSLTAELESYRKVTDQNEREECSPETIDNMLNEIGELEEQVAELTAERDKLNEDCSSLDKCCNALEEELKRVRAERNICRWNLGELENNIGREIAELLDENGVIEVFKEPLGKRRLITETQRQLEKQVEKLTAERDELNAKLKEAEEDIRDLDLEGYVLADKLAAAEDMLHVVMKGGEPNYDEWMWQHDGLNDWFKENFTKTVPQLEAEVEAQRKRANDAERCVLSEEWYVCRDRYEDDIAELTAERDRMQRVIDTQAESFKKLEAELKAADDTANTLRASVAGLKETVENQKAEILRLKDENAELCMKVHGAPF